MTIGVVTVKLAADSVPTVPPVSAALQRRFECAGSRLADAGAVMPAVIARKGRRRTSRGC